MNGINLGTINGNNVAYSMAYTRLGCGSSTSEIYLDNLYTYSGEFSPEKLTPSYVTSVTGGAVEEDVITVPYGTKVSEISSILTTDDGNSDIVRIYTDSSMTTEADPTASANGTTLVGAATNGADKEMAYSYYTVEEPDPDADVLKGNNAADLSIADNTDYAAGGTDAEIELSDDGKSAVLTQDGKSVKLYVIEENLSFSVADAITPEPVRSELLAISKENSLELHKQNWNGYKDGDTDTSNDMKKLKITHSGKADGTITVVLLPINEIVPENANMSLDSWN